MTSSPPGPLLGVRAALVILLAILVGLAAVGLTFLTGQSIPAAILTGGAAAGGALLFFNQMIGQLAIVAACGRWPVSSMLRRRHCLHHI